MIAHPGSEPLVSVIMAVKDSARFLPETLASLEAQNLHNWELVAFDDGSSDGSMELIKARLGNRAVVGHTGGGRGPAVARNQAFAMARGRYFAILDSDDLSRPERFETQVRWLEADARRSACAAWAEQFGMGAPATIGKPLGSLRASLVFRNPVVHSTLMIRRPCKPSPSQRFDESLRYSHDYDLIARLAFEGEMSVLPQVLGDYRIHSRQVSREHAESQRFFAIAVQHRLLAHFGLQPDKVQASLHYRLGLGAGLASESELVAASKWLRKLKEANRGSNILPNSELTRVVGKIWTMTCSNSPLSPFQAASCWLRQVQTLGLSDFVGFTIIMLRRMFYRLFQRTKPTVMIQPSPRQ
jgi:glycosyltransferase involved in cell wall biosynthesis